MWSGNTQEMREKISKKEQEDLKIKEQQEAYRKNIVYIGGKPAVGTAAVVQRNYWVSKCSDVFWGVAPFVLFASFMYIVQLVLKSS